MGAIALIIRDVQHRRLAQTRLDLLTKLSALVGMLEYDDVAEALAQVPIPEFADWCVINFIESEADPPHVHRAPRSVEGAAAGRDPARAPRLGRGTRSGRRC